MDTILDLINNEAVSRLLGEGFQSSFAQNTLSFLVAMWIVKKDMTKQFDNLTQAINNVAATVASGFLEHTKRIDDLAGRVQKLEETK